MAYHINELRVMDFIGDNTIKLPRFQRRHAWDEKKDFGLCISLFKGYPLGVVIYNHTKVLNREINYLLDGRQRRAALKGLIENPALLYAAARKYLGIKVSTPIDEVKEIFWKKVGVYLNTATETPDNASADSTSDDTECGDSDIDAETQRGNLKLLFSLIELLHGSGKKDVTAFERRWNFGKYFNYIPYIDKQTKVLDPRKLKDFLTKDLADKFIDAECFTQEAFSQHLLDNYDIIAGEEAKFKQYLDTVFDSLARDFRVMVLVQTTVFDQAYLGVIKLLRVSSLDSQNIFSLVNKSGTPLKAEELLSAKPYWNEEVKAAELDVETRNAINTLYQGLKIPGENDPHNGHYVNWDLCATFIDRIDKHHLLFPVYADDESGLLLKIQHGFKTVAALTEGGVSAVKVEEMETDKNLNLLLAVSKLRDKINKIVVLLLGNSFFKGLHAWQKPISVLIGITPALEFLAILSKLWDDYGCETGDNEKKFVHSAICLFDRLLLEYGLGEWKGSSDSNMAKHLKGDLAVRVSLVDESAWTAYIDRACMPTDNDYKKNGSVLYYFAVLQGRSPENIASVKYEIDHIISQDEFDQLPSGTDIDVGLKNCLGNVSLLPRDQNESKGSKKLCELGDSLKRLVSRYSDIAIGDFQKFSNVASVSQLVKERKQAFLTAISKRQAIVVA